MENSSRATTVGGGVVLGAIITGVAALGMAASNVAAGHFEAASLALLAAAVAFVGTANAIFRH